MMMFRKDRSGDALELFDAIQSDVFQALELMGAQVADDWKELIAVDVGYTIGPRGGVHVVRSKPGEPPRRETGDLYDSVDEGTESDDAVVTLSVNSDIEYAPYLEEGTDHMEARPHCERTFEKWADEVVEAVAQAIESPSH